MKLRPRKVPLLVATVLVLALGLGVWVIHYRGKRAVADYKKQLVAAGEKLTVAELIPPPVPPEQNSADIFLKAVSLLNGPQSLLATNPPHTMVMIAHGKAMIGWAQPDIRDHYENKFTNTWAEADAEIAQLSEGLELLWQVIENPRIDFGLDYQQGFSLLLPNLAQTKQAAQRLSAAALCDLHRGDTASATLNARAMLALVNSSENERLVISHLVRVAIAALSVPVTWELLQSPNVTDAQLAALQRDWTELEFIQVLENALAMERAMGEMTVAQMRNSSGEFQKAVSGFAWRPAGASASSPDDWFGQAMQFAGDAWDKTKFKTKEVAWRVAWSYSDQLRRLKGDQLLLEAARRARTNGCFLAAIQDQARQFEALGISRPTLDNEEDVGPADLDFRSMLSQSILSLDHVLKRTMLNETSRKMTVTAIALKRYRLRHGNYPSDLAELVAEFLPAIPRDPVDGLPLRYRASNDGTFLLYSVGEDGEDQGGNPKPVNEKSESRQWQRGRDWVWPQPASSEEIEAYFESLRQKNRADVESGNSTNTVISAEQLAFMKRYGLQVPNATDSPTNSPATNTAPRNP